MACAITVNAVAISSAAEQTLQTITDATGGQIFFVGAAADQSNFLADSLRSVAQLNTPVLRRLFTLLSQSFQLDAAASFSRDVIVDSTLGSSLSFTFDFTSGSVAPSVTSPSGILYDVTSNFLIFDATLRSYVFTIPDNIFEVRQLKYTILFSVFYATPSLEQYAAIYS